MTHRNTTRWMTKQFPDDSVMPGTINKRIFQFHYHFWWNTILMKHKSFSCHVDRKMAKECDVINEKWKKKSRTCCWLWTSSGCELPVSTESRPKWISQIFYCLPINGPRSWSLIGRAVPLCSLHLASIDQTNGQKEEAIDAQLTCRRIEIFSSNGHPPF